VAFGPAETVVKVEYDEPATKKVLDEIQQKVDQSKLIVGFNLKYDLHWLRRYGIMLSDKARFWCCQIAQFVIQHQQNRYPSLNECCAFWGLEQKLSVIEQEYWSKGVDTLDIPWNLLEQYALQDVILTRQLYEKQLAYLADKPKLARLISLCNQDMRVLLEIESNGLPFDEGESQRRAEKIKEQLLAIDEDIRSFVGQHPINFNSVDHISCILYGGTIKFKVAEPYEYMYKGGAKAGQLVTRNKWTTTQVTFPRIVEPLSDTELAKEGYWSTDERVLGQLKAKGPAKQLLQKLQERGKLERLMSTYYLGFTKKRIEMDWPVGVLHSQMNQCVVISGRLSSSSPNQQNIPPSVLELVHTRFD
jgi:DNA polymerase-1